MMDLNDVKAGKYELVARRWDQITSKPGEPLDYVRHRRGDIVELNAEDAKRLVGAGAVVKPGQLQRSAAEQARALAERAQRDYEAVLAGLPEDVRAEVAPGTVSQEPDGGEPVFDISTLGTAGIGETTKWVGKDKARAEQALSAEQAKPEGDQRESLVTKLQKVIEA